jgi:propionyl-CoA carboxylase beta chain
MTSVTEPDIHTTAGKLADLRKRAEETLHPVGEGAVEKTHAKGKLTARERILALLDDDSFVELDALARHRATTFNLQENRPVGDGVVTSLKITGPTAPSWRKGPRHISGRGPRDTYG